MDALSHITDFIVNNQYIIAIITPLTVGEVNMHALGILFGAGTIPIYPFLVSIVSILVIEIGIYTGTQLLKRRVTVAPSIREKPFLKKLDAVLVKYDQQFHNHQYLLFIAMKMMPMTKIIIFLFALRYRIPIRDFMIKDTVVTVLWSLLLFFPGWFVGRELLTQEAGLSIVKVGLYVLAIIILIVLFGKPLQQVFDTLLKKVARHLQKNGSDDLRVH